MLEVGFWVVGAVDVLVVVAAVAVVVSVPKTPVGASITVAVSTVVMLTVVVSTVVVLTGATTTVVDVVVTAAGVVDVEAAGVVVSGIGGGMMLRVRVAPHCSREVPLGQQCALVQ